MDFYLYLPSNTGDFIDNKLSNFRVNLPTKIDLEGEWAVALVEIAYPITWFNIGSDEEGLVSVQFINQLEYRQKTVPYTNYNSIDGLCDAIHYTLDNMRSFGGERVNFNFQYDNIRHRIGLKPLSDVGKPNVTFLHLSPRLQYMLRFKNRQLELAYAKMELIFKDSKEVVSGDIELYIINRSTRSDDEDEEMIEQINSVINGLRDGGGNITGCKMRFFPAKAEIVLESSESNFVQLNITENLQYRLGMTDNIIYRTSSIK